MDADLPHLGTVPVPPDTIHWFEFLLDPNLLKKHLSDPNPVPTGTDLILEFLSVDENNVWELRAEDPDAPPTPPAARSPGAASWTPLTRKQLALKVLALKTAATLNWNLDSFESKLTPAIQLQMVLDFVYIATDGAFSEPPKDIPSDLLLKPQVEFALILYHRWILRFPVKAALQAKTAGLPSTSSGVPPENEFTLMNSNYHKILSMSESRRAESIIYLEEVLLNYKPANIDEHKKIQIPIIEAFAQPTEDADKMNHNWKAGDVFISQYELAMQIHFDLCYNYFFYEQHDMAKKHILGCKENYSCFEKVVSKYGYSDHNQVPWGKLNYASMTKDDMIGYIRALNLGHELLNEEPSLLQRLQESMKNHYSGITAVLQADNLTREIPIIHRQLVEADLQGKAKSGTIIVTQDLLLRVSALNAVRYALRGGIPSTHPDFLNKFKTSGVKFFDILIWAMAPVLTSNLSGKDWDRLKRFFLHLWTTRDCEIPIDRTDHFLRLHVGEAASSIRQKLISDEHFEILLAERLGSEASREEFPLELLTADWDIPGSLTDNLQLEREIMRLKKRLIDAPSPEDVRLTLLKLSTLSPTTQVWKLDPNWQPIGDSAKALMLLPRGFLRDFGYVLSVLAQWRMEAGQPQAALSMLNALQNEVCMKMGGCNDPALDDLSGLVAWEQLMLQIYVTVDEWPHRRFDATELAKNCKACIAAAKAPEGVHPRPQAVHAAWIGLVNLCEWKTGAVPSGPGVLVAALCGACAELKRGKGSTKFPNTFWDYMLSALDTGKNCLGERTMNQEPGPSKSPKNNPVNHLNYHGQMAGRGVYHALLHGLREPTAISVLLSILAKIYNLLVNESSLELVVEYTNLWPDVITNSAAYDTTFILESLKELLEKNLKTYPYNDSWLRLYGDVEMAAGKHNAALRHYLCSLSVATCFFTTRAPNEADIAGRAARCCQALRAHTQAAALYQLVGEPDSANALKCLFEQSSTTTDCTDAYYSFFWDTNLLEAAAAMHAQRGETERCEQAKKAAGALELNANNSEEIKRQAVGIRRGRLLRALTDQYVTKHRDSLFDI